MQILGISHFMLYIANIIEEGKLGGPQIRITLAAKALKGQIETTVIMPDENSGDFRRQCNKLDIQYKVFSLTRITKEKKAALRYLLFSPIEILRLCFFFKKENFDIIHVSGGSWQYKGVIAGRLAGRKVLWHLNDTSMPYLFRKLFSLFSHLTDGYIFASDRSKQYYGSIGKKGKPEFVIPAPVDVASFDPAGKYEEDKKEINHWQDKIVIGTVANINPIKGLELFIRSAAKLNALFPDLVFVIIGTTYPRQKNYLQSLKKLTEDLQVRNIDFVGTREDIRPLLQRFDIYTCTSLAESSPISVWEAMSMEKPIVSTDVGDVPVYIKNGENGYITDVNDTDAMTEKISLLIENKKLRSKFGKNSRKIAKLELDISRCAKCHLSAYIAIMNTPL